MVTALTQAFNTGFELTGHLHRYEDFIMCVLEERQDAPVGLSPFPPFAPHVCIDEKHI